MPLLDHFNPPLAPTRHWESFHSTWANTITQRLNAGLLPADYYAEPYTNLGGQIEVDVATFEKNGAGSGGIAVETAAWAPPKALLTSRFDSVNLDAFEINIYQNFGGAQLRGAIELVSPANKDRPSTRRAFVIKCAGYLQRRVAVVIIDVVTERSANLHRELQQILKLGGEISWDSQSGLYAVAYRTAAEKEHQRLEVWPETLTLGQPLPTLPLWLDFDLCVPLHLEESYRAACESLRIRL